MGDFLYMCVCSVEIYTGSFIIRRGIFLSTDETHKAFVLFSVYLDIRRCFLYPKALRPQNYKAGLSYTWQFQAPFQLHVIHEHFCLQTLSSITKRLLPVFISGTVLRFPQILLRAKILVHKDDAERKE